MQTISTENFISPLNLTPFRRRIRLLRVWRCAGIGGAGGAILALVLAVSDYFAVHYFSSWQLAAPILLGLLAGALKAALEPLPDARIAQSVDRRAGLNDRLTTASEIPATDSPLSDAQQQDAMRHLASVRARDLYRLRPNRWHAALLVGSALSALVFLLGNSGLLRSANARQEAAELKQAAPEVQRVAKPALEAAQQANASETNKELARRLEQFTQELQKARMTKQEALLKANQLAEDAKKLQQPNSAALASAVEKAQTASAQMEKLAEHSRLEKSDALKQAEQEATLQKQIADMERKLAAQAGQQSLSPQEKAKLEKSLAQAKRKLQNLKLSKRAEAFLQKLQSMPDYKEAQEILAKLAQEAAAQQAGAMSEMTPEQLEAAAKRLEELAKKFGSEAQMKELAKQMLEAAKNGKLCKGGGLPGGLMGAFGLGISGASSGSPQRGPGGLSLGGGKGAGGPSDDHWVGPHGEINKDDKSSLLNAKLEDRMITSQIGDKGPQDYIETLGPSRLGNRTKIPYQKALPKYEKSAESALQKSDIPPRLRGKVRDYFDSLHK